MMGTASMKSSEPFGGQEDFLTIPVYAKFVLRTADSTGMRLQSH